MKRILKISQRLWYKRKAVSPVIAVILLIGLTVLAGAMIAFIVLPLISPGDNPIFVVTLDESYDYNDDDKADALLLEVRNVDTVAGTTSFVSLENWFIAPGYEDQEIPAGGVEKVLVYTSLVSAQLEKQQDIEIGVSSKVEAPSKAQITIGALIKPDPVTVRVIGGEDPIIGEIITFETGDGLPASFPPTPTDENGEVTADLIPNWYYAKTNTGLESELFHRLLNKTVVITTESREIETINVRVLDGSGDPISAIRVFDADTQQHDLGRYVDTNATGFAVFQEMPGTYLFYVNYLSEKYWSSTVTVPGSDGTTVTIQISGGDLIGLAVFGDTPIGNGRLIRLYTANNASMGKYDYTNSSSYFEFTGIPSGLYRLRLDYQSSYYWSKIISTATPNLVVDFGGGKISN
jgi:flagellin-like protein